MYLFFFIFFILISVFLIFLIVLSPGKGLNNSSNFNTAQNIKFFSHFGKQNFITNIITTLSFLFLIFSIVLCNINNRKIDADFFLKDHVQNSQTNESLLEKKSLNSDIPI